ncbi:MAG TPA: FmdB family zinc ribbon protein [Acidimicrobiales bacterium]
MPTYEYACKSCGEHLEVVQSFKDDPLRTCPNCEGELRKVFGSIGIAFKGSGFYKTDSRGGSSSKSESSSSKSEAATPSSSDSSPSSSSSSSSSSGTESKSAAAS